MNCFSCKKDCVMQTELYMDKTTCMVCEHGGEIPTKACWECIKRLENCNFKERITGERRVQELF